MAHDMEARDMKAHDSANGMVHANKQEEHKAAATVIVANGDSDYCPFGRRPAPYLRLDAGVEAS